MDKMKIEIIVKTDADPATLLEWAHEMAERLSNDVSEDVEVVEDEIAVSYIEVEIKCNEEVS